MLTKCLVPNLARSKCPTHVSNGDDVGDGDGEITPDPNKIGVRRGSSRSLGTQEREDVVWRLDTQPQLLPVWCSHSCCVSLDLGFFILEMGRRTSFP